MAHDHLSFLLLDGFYPVLHERIFLHQIFHLDHIADWSIDPLVDHMVVAVDTLVEVAVVEVD